MTPVKRKAAATRKKSTAKKTANKGKAGKKAKKDDDFFDHNVEVARRLASIADDHAVSEMIYETDSLTLTIRRGEGGHAPVQMVAAPSVAVAPAPAPVAVAPAPAAAAPAPAAAPAEADDDSLHVVTSPFVGTFYRAPNPDSPAYVEPGQSVTKGQILCIVEAMKLMNEIEADIDGTIKTILVKNAESVEYGQSLFKIEPA